MTATVVKFPFERARRAYARRPRKSKNGTPEQRASKARECEALADLLRLADEIDAVQS